MAADKSGDVVVRVDKVFKDFALMSEKSNSIKSSFTQAFAIKRKAKRPKYSMPCGTYHSTYIRRILRHCWSERKRQKYSPEDHCGYLPAK